MKSLRIEWIVLSAVAAIGTGLALFLSLRSGSFLYENEWVHALLQVGLIAVFGIVTSGVLEYFKDALQRRRDNSKLMFDVLNELNRAYADVKLARRKIQRSSSFLPDDVAFLNERQVLLELHKKNSTNLFSDPEKIESHLQKMETYLNHATNDEFSSQRAGFLGAGFKEFSEQYDRLRVAIQNDISPARKARSPSRV